MELKKIKVWSFVKMSVLIGLIFGIIAGVVLSIYLTITINSITTQMSNPDVQAYLEQSGSNISDVISGLKILSKTVLYIIPILFAVISFVLSLLISVIYNLLSKYLGGIKFDLEK